MTDGLFDDGNGPGPEIGTELASCIRCRTIIDEHRRDVETGVEHTERFCASVRRWSRSSAFRAVAARGPADPRTTCPGCGRPAIDGKVTCGDVRCGSSTGQDRMR
jgi:hypothetical protein